MSANLSRMSAVSWPLIQTHQVTMNNGWMDGQMDGWMDGWMWPSVDRLCARWG